MRDARTEARSGTISVEKLKNKKADKFIYGKTKRDPPTAPRRGSDRYEGNRRSPHSRNIAVVCHVECGVRPLCRGGGTRRAHAHGVGACRTFASREGNEDSAGIHVLALIRAVIDCGQLRWMATLLAELVCVCDHTRAVHSAGTARTNALHAHTPHTGSTPPPGDACALAPRNATRPAQLYAKRRGRDERKDGATSSSCPPCHHPHRPCRRGRLAPTVLQNSGR
jgi:hypothetical protein